jgi:hypothetical protein
MRTPIVVVALLCALPSFATKHVFLQGEEKAEIQTEFEKVDRGLGKMVLRSRVPALELIDNGDRNGSELVVPGLLPSQDMGSPELPSSGVVVAVPNGYDIQLENVRVNEETLDKVFIRPAQRKFRCGGNGDFFAFNAEAYAEKEAIPHSWINVEEVGKIQDLRLVRIGVNPLRWEPHYRKLRIAVDLQATIGFVQVSKAAPVRVSASLAKVIVTSIANGTEISRLLSVSDAPDSMVIVVADEYREAIRPLIEWKHKKGIQTKVVTYSEAGKSKEKVKAYLQNYYDQASLKPTYFLFVGNQDTLPGFTEETVNGPAVSDYRYTLLSGEDRIPDVLHGRIAADREEEVAVQVRRWINYERAPESQIAYAMGMTIASKDTYMGQPYDNEYTAMIQKVLKSHTYQAVDDYWEKNFTATTPNIHRSLQEGRSWVTYIGHGSDHSWSSSNDDYSNDDIRKLTQTSVLPFIVDVACVNGRWANSSNCFGETWVKHTYNGQDAGAVSYFGASQNTNWHEPAVLAVGAAEAHVQKKLETLGSTVLAGQLHLVAKMGKGNNVISNFQWYNLLGDPSLFVRTVAPRKYSVVTSFSDAVSVKALDEKGAGVPNLIAAVTDRENRILAVKRTDSSGVAVLGDRNALPADVKLTVTGYNAETYEQIIR